MNYEVQNPNYEAEIRASFAKQGLLKHLGAEFVDIQPGRVSLKLPFSENLTQQNGFFHAGAITSIVDVACGYAAFSLMPPNSAVLSIEFKENFVAPAVGEEIIARGWVIKPGRTITVSQGEVYAVQNGKEKLCATMLATMICKERRDETG